MTRLSKSCDKVAMIRSDVMNLGNYIKWLKPYCKQRRISDERFVEYLINPIVKSENICNKEGELLYLDKSRVSNTLTHKDDVPEALREALVKNGVEERMSERFFQFYQKYIDISREEDLIGEFTGYIKNDSISKKEKAYILSDNAYVFLMRLFLSTIKQDNKAADSKNLIVWQRGNNYVKVIEGDLFKKGFDKRNRKNRIVVVPVNTSFETRLTDNTEEDTNPFVSTETIHGVFLNRLYIQGISPTDIKKRIETNLKKNCMKTSKDGDYPIGTIATLKFGNTIFFLLAASKFNKRNTAHSSKTDIEKAINNFTKYYDEKGQGYDAFIPLIGTGMSRAYLSNQESYDIIKYTLLNNKDKLQGKINIVILPSVIDEIEI